MPQRPNILFVLADQLRAASLPLYGNNQIATPHLDRLAAQGTTFSNTISTYPVCTPYRSMLVTGRHPQTTGHLLNHVRTRHDEISIADAFAHAGYRTGWVGKWHLHNDGFFSGHGPDYVPEGRDRLGFDYWRAYNCHMEYFDGFVHLKDWHVEPWKGYETDGLAGYAEQFISAEDRSFDCAQGRPFCLFVSPHQPHWTYGKFAPDEYYARLPRHLALPANVSAGATEALIPQYRHYLAMTLALDDMMGRLMADLDRSGLAENTIVVFTSDHGTMMGAHADEPWFSKLPPPERNPAQAAWEKMLPWQESIHVPLIARWPGRIAAAAQCDALTAPVDFFPTLCGLCGVKVPRTVEGMDLSDTWLARPGAARQEALLTMNYIAGWPGYLTSGNEWRGVRTRRHSYARWLDGRAVLYDLQADPLEMNNLADAPAARDLRRDLESQLQRLLAQRGDTFAPCTEYADWFDAQRRIVRNAFGALGNPDKEPDLTLLEVLTK
ncbi:MAG: sulfatase [Planctomycetaceae bacterium]|nr:sulfatase [Planctomycetaceae bacterium]